MKKISPIDLRTNFFQIGYLRFFKNSQVFYRKQRAHDKDIEGHRVYIKIYIAVDIAIPCIVIVHSCELVFPQAYVILQKKKDNVRDCKKNRLKKIE